MAHVKGPDLPTGGEIVSPRADLVQMYETGNGSFKARATYEIEDGEIVIDALPFQVSGSQGARADRGAEAAEEAAHGGLHARRVRSRESDASGDRAEVEPRRCGGAHEPPVRHHRSRAQLPRESQRDRPRRPAARDGLEAAAARVARVPQGDRDAPAEAPPREGERAAAHPRRPADRLPQPRRGDPHRAPRGRAEARADQALQALRRSRPRPSSRPSCGTSRASRR